MKMEYDAIPLAEGVSVDADLLKAPKFARDLLARAVEDLGEGDRDRVKHFIVKRSA